jgi:hypothetical protein
MTALQKYIRLEATGQWRESKGQGPREVLVSFGKATLVLSDFKDRPLTHWSLAAIGVVGTGPGVTYALDAGAEETLEIDDAEMNAAIAEVTAEARAMAAQTNIPRQGRRWGLAVGLLLVLTGLAAWKLPDALRAHALGLIPAEKALLIGEDVLAAMDIKTCTSPLGERGIARLRAAPQVSAQTPIIIIADASPEVARLPGGGLVISQDVLRRMPNSDVLAGWVGGLLADRTDAPLGALMQQKSVLQTLGFLASGNLATGDVAWMARRAERGQPAPSDGYLKAALQRAAEAHDTSGPVMRDQVWVALQEICGA